MDFSDKLNSIQKSLKIMSLDGWLLYDFRKTNDLACRFLEISQEKMCTRRFFYWIPREGVPVKIVHRIESQTLQHLPGTYAPYSAWKELEEQLKSVLNGKKKIAMEYSPRNAIPYVSKVDAGTVEVVRGFGPEVVSSADLLQRFTSVWTQFQLESHIAAGQALEEAVDNAWHLIATSLKNGKKLTEWDVQQFILDEFKRQGCVADDPPICAVNAHSADPHYSPDSKSSSVIKFGDFVLIDLWCKKNAPHAVYADITRVGVAAPSASVRQLEIFNIVKKARDAATLLLQTRLTNGVAVMGWELDQACREVINQAGYGEFFTHRTGHNIGEKDHGDGANIDNFETQDRRVLLPGTCFSIEPGIYLPGDFGVRLEHDVYVELDGRHFRVTGLQESIVLMTTLSK